MTDSASLDETLAELRRLLDDDRERTVELILALRQSLTSIMGAAQATSTDDEHDPEGATIAFERSQAAALLSGAETRLSEIDHAIRKIAEGGYGRCERCGTEIASARLLARPAARTCIRCAA